MFNAVVRVDIGQVERVRPVAAVEHVRGVFRDKEAERRRKVVRPLHEGRQLLERDVAARVRENTCTPPSWDRAPNPNRRGVLKALPHVNLSLGMWTRVRTMVRHRVQRGA